MPVEEAYDRYHSRIAILGGIDLDFVCRSTPEQIYQTRQSPCWSTPLPAAVTPWAPATAYRITYQMRTSCG